MIIAFGLPHHSHEDDPVRAVKAALEIQQRMRVEVGIKCSIGVTTGTAFCGSIGSLQRCEYSIVGDTVRKMDSTTYSKVNLSARLMVAASKTGYGVLVDRQTFELVSKYQKRSFHFKALEPIKVKGKVNPISIYRPMGHTSMREGIRVRRARRIVRIDAFF